MGMKLRSGTVINCIKNTPFYVDVVEFHDNISLPPTHECDKYTHEFSQNYCGDCFSIMEHIRFIERHHDTLLNESEIKKFYQKSLNVLNKDIELIESGKRTCKCWQYLPYHVTDGACMLTDEYNYINSIDHSSYESTKNITPANPSFYSKRTISRIYHNNFLVATEETDVYGENVKKHDYTQILNELKLWQRYFRKASRASIKAAQKTLKNITIDDCTSKILEFLI
jgi:hypothetical protein